VPEKMPLDNMITLQNQAYGYDPDMKFTAKTKKDKIREANLKKIEEFKQIS
jgi:hypothetical protein